MPRYKLILEYDGTPFSGWQRHDGNLTVQGVLEEALAKFLGRPAEVSVAGRTDAGVHAIGQVAHADFHEPRDAFNIREGLNRLMLPHPVVVLGSEEVPSEWHARFDAKRRHYLYRILNRDARPTLDEKRAWHVFKDLNLVIMQEAANMLLGTHDFTSFRSTQCQSKSPVKTLDSLTISSEDDEVHIRTSARSFLHNQVRIMVGTLVLVGTGKWSLDDFKKALAAKDRTAGGTTAAAHGLYLMKVDY